MNKKLARTYIKAGLSDFRNIISHGFQAPKYAERIWVEPLECDQILDSGTLRIREFIGRVTSKEWDSCRQLSLDENVKIKYCRKHWIEGLSWAESGAYDYLMDQIEQFGTVDKCNTLEDLQVRFKNLDTVYNAIKRTGELLPVNNFRKNTFREENGILIHINAQGKPVFGGSGHHRIAIAKILNLKFPAMLGMVHTDGVKHLKNFRNR